jgi:predicted nicotinamide N-methyase
MPSVTETPIPGGWSERDVLIGPHTFRLLVPAEPDAFLEHLEEPVATGQPHLADPYWAKLWPAASDLAAAISRANWEPGMPCLELGCGSGLVGIAALAAGLDVTFSDYIPFTVRLAQENAARNGFAAAKGLVLDWRQPLAEQWPLIVAADVTYDRTHILPLLDLLDRMLTPGGEAWFGDAGRGPAEEFVSTARNRGWTVKLFNDHDQPASTIKLGEFRRIVLQHP